MLAAKRRHRLPPDRQRGILTLGAGILILAIPKALNYIVAVYLILIGLGILFDVRGF